MDNKSIINFVRKTLGCTCPDDVFQHIECQTDIGLGDGLTLDFEINIGNRLLIYVVTIEEVDLLRFMLSQLVRIGTHHRCQRGFNRFRLVLLIPKMESVENKALDVFRSLNQDEKVHLHMVNKDDFPLTLNQ